jgi:hypothetical protein
VLKLQRLSAHSRLLPAVNCSACESVVATMPLVNLYLFSLSEPLPRFLSALRASIDPKHVIAVSRPRYLYIPSTTLDAHVLNSTTWNVLLLVHSDGTISSECQSMVTQQYKLTVGVPSKLLAAYPSHNARLIRDAPGVELTCALDEALGSAASRSKASGDNLELSEDLLRFMEHLRGRGEDNRPVSMLNLLQFRPGQRESYMKYGQGFKQAGGRRGGDAKIVGAVVSEGDSAEAGRWDEIAFVHYPR